MGPKWLQNGSQMAPRRPLGGPGAPKSIFERFWGPFWHPFWLPKLSKMEPIFFRKSSTGCERHFGSSGCLLGPFWGRCWGHFGVLFRSPARKPDFVRIVLPPAREHDFHGFGRSESAKNVSGSSVRQEACSKSVLGGSWERFLNILGPFWIPKSVQKSIKSEISSGSLQNPPKVDKLRHKAAQWEAPGVPRAAPGLQVASPEPPKIMKNRPLGLQVDPRRPPMVPNPQFPIRNIDLGPRICRETNKF